MTDLSLPPEFARGAQPLRPAVVRRAHVVRGQGVQPVQQDVRGPDHLPRRPGRRRVGQRRDGPAAGARGRPTRTATSSCTSTRPGGSFTAHDGDLRHHAVRPAGHPDGLPGPGGQRGGGAARRPARRASGWRCRTRGSSSTSRPPRAATGRARTSRSRPGRSCGCARQLEDMLSRHSGQPIEQVRKDIDRDKILTAEEAKEYGLVDTS